MKKIKQAKLLIISLMLHQAMYTNAVFPGYDKGSYELHNEIRKCSDRRDLFLIRKKYPVEPPNPKCVSTR